MKNDTIFFMVQKLYRRYGSKKNIKMLTIAVFVGLVSIITIIGFAGWILVPKVESQVAKWNLQEQIGSMDGFKQNATAIVSPSCWAEAQSLLDIAPWATKPISENLNGLKVACFDFEKANCENEPCTQIKNDPTNKESEATI